MIRFKCLIFFIILKSYSQNKKIDEVYDIIATANRSYLDQDMNINYLKPLELLEENLNNSYGIDNNYNQDYLSYLKTAYSYVHFKNLTLLNDQDKIELPKETSLINPIAFLREVIGNKRLVMINEAHDAPEHRLFAESLLDLLYEKGFRILAVETLYWSDKELNDRKFALSTTGYYTREPYFANFIRFALKLGFTIIPYEQKNGSKSINDREINQANNLINVLIKNPSSKIFVYAGYSHIKEKSNVEGIKWMAERIKDSLKIDPFTIDQTTFTENSNENKISLINLQYNQVKDSVLNDFIEVYDVSIVNTENYESQHLNIGRTKYTFSLKDESFTKNSKYLIAQAYVFDEYNEYGNQAIPFDQKLVLNMKDEIELYLFPEEKYYLIIKDSENNIYVKNKIFID